MVPQAWRGTTAESCHLWIDVDGYWYITFNAHVLIHGGMSGKGEIGSSTCVHRFPQQKHLNGLELFNLNLKFKHLNAVLLS